MTAGALALVAMGVVAAGSHSDTVNAQALSCGDARDNQGNLPRCVEVIKQTVPDGSPGSFTINYSIDPPGANNTTGGSQNLADNGSFSIPLGSNDTPAGTVFTFTESAPAGWVMSVNCVGAGIDAATIGNGVVVTYTGNLGNAPYAYARCTFTNERQDTATPTPTSTPSTSTATPTSTTATPTPTNTPVLVYDPFTPSRTAAVLPDRTAADADADRVAPLATTAPVSNVRPPSTGDGGLK